MPDHITFDELQNEMDAQLRFPGITNIWTMPIKNRIDMLSTGVRTPIGIKILGPDLKVIQRIGEELEAILRDVPGTRSVLAERTAGGYYLDFDLDRDALARYGLSVEDAQTIDHCRRSAARTSPPPSRAASATASTCATPASSATTCRRCAACWCRPPSGAQIPLAQIADIRMRRGAVDDPRRERPARRLRVRRHGRPRRRRLRRRGQARGRASSSTCPTGYTLVWSGQYENMARVRERLKVVLPLTLFLIALLLYMNTNSAVKAGIVLLAVPFSLIGAIWLLYLLGYNVSIAVWVGMIALMGLDAETGVFMLLFLDLAYDERVRAGRMRTARRPRGGDRPRRGKRIRPKMMTVTAMFMGLLPIMWSIGTGADVMKRIAAPMVGGLVTCFLLELLVYPVIYVIWKRMLLEPPVAAPSSGPLPEK